MLLAISVGEANNGVASAAWLNGVHPATIKVGNACVASSAAFDLTNNCVQRTDYGPTRTVEVVARCQERMLYLDLSQTTGFLLVVEVTAIQPAVMCSAIWHLLSR